MSLAPGTRIGPYDVAGPLEAAHEQVITHRDLKPANIKVRADGTVKVLDVARGKLTGDPVTLADRVGVDAKVFGGVAVSAAGPVASRAGGSASRQLTWFDRTGKAVGTLARGAEAHGAGQRRRLADGSPPRRDDAPDRRCSARPQSHLVAGRNADRLLVEPNRRPTRPGRVRAAVERVWLRGTADGFA